VRKAFAKRNLRSAVMGAYPCRLYKLALEGKVLGVPGESGKQPKQFG